MKRILVLIAILLVVGSCWEFHNSEQYRVILVLCNRTDVPLYIKYDTYPPCESQFDRLSSDSLLVICSTYSDGSEYESKYLDCSAFWLYTDERLCSVSVFLEQEDGPIKQWHYDDMIFDAHDMFDKYDWVLLPDKKLESGMIQRTWVFEITSDDLTQLPENIGNL